MLIVFGLFVFFAACVVVALPIVIGVIVYDEVGGGPYCRSRSREDRKAERDYVRALPPAEREAYQRHEARKREYIRQRAKHGPGIDGLEWRDVTLAPDYEGDTMSRIRLQKNPREKAFLMYGRKWSPPATEKSERARWLNAASGFMDEWAERGSKAVSKARIDGRVDFDSYFVNSYPSLTGVVDVSEDGEGTCVGYGKDALGDSDPIELSVKRFVATVTAVARDGMPMELQMILGVSKDAGKICVVEALEEDEPDRRRQAPRGIH